MTSIGNFLGRLANVDERHGPLPLLLIGLTMLTGMVDAISFLRLGHVFVANMTGNIVFLGFAAAGVGDFSISASLLALFSFLLGAFVGGRLGRSFGGHRGHLFWLAVLLETVLMALALVLTVILPPTQPALTPSALIASLGIMMGLQNAVVRRLAVPDLTTTVLTLTLTGIAADQATSLKVPLRRLASVAAMFVGAIIGGLLVLRMDTLTVLAAALVLLLVIAIVGYCGRKTAQDWARP